MTEQHKTGLPDANRVNRPPALMGSFVLLGGSVLAAPFVYFGVENKIASALNVQSSAGPVAVVLASLYLNGVLAMRVNQARIKYNVAWPNLYATGESTDSHMFNCIQRSHQHYLETLPGFYAALFVASQSFPWLSTIAGLIFLAGRVVAAKGYSSGDVTQKERGMFAYFGYFLLGGLGTIGFVRLLQN